MALAYRANKPIKSFVRMPVFLHGACHG